MKDEKQDGNADIDRNRFPRRCLLIISLVQMLLSITFYIILGFASDFAKLSILDKYSALKTNGIINQANLEKYKDGRFSNDWVELPYYLIENFDSVKRIAVIACIGDGLISIIIFILWFNFDLHRPSCSGSW